MQDIIFSQVPISELVNLIASELELRISKPEYRPPLQDEIGIDEAAQVTGRKKSTIYRDSMNGVIPCGRRGKRLIFSRKDLQEWMRCNTVTKTVRSSKVLSNLSESALNK